MHILQWSNFLLQRITIYDNNNNNNNNNNNGNNNHHYHQKSFDCWPPTSFFSVTSTNVRGSPKNFLIFNSNPFVTLVQNFKTITNASSDLLNMNQEHPSKNWFFWSNTYKNEVMVNSIIELTKLWSHDRIYNIIWVTW